MQERFRRREPPRRFNLDALRAFAAAIGMDPEAAIVDNGGRQYIAAPEGRRRPGSLDTGEGLSPILTLNLAT